jgi:glycosyltransferase involved in cell wall biosynthesis
VRLGIYVDDVYRIVDHGALARVSTDRAFLLFACDVGSRFDRLVIFGRSVESPEHADYVLPTGISLAPLPHYASLRSLRQVARASAGTARAMWRGLAEVDIVWAFGPHPFEFLLVALATARRKRIVLGVRQDTVVYFRGRLPSRAWGPGLAIVRAMDAAHRLLARRLPVTVVGRALARQYGDRPSVMAMTVSLVPDAAVADSAPVRSYEKAIHLLTVGRLEQEKNPLLVVEMLAELERRRPGVFRLTWIGRGSLEDEVRRRARYLGVSERLDLIGYVPFGEDLLQRYRDAHTFVHVSFTEGVPQVLLEALACATPIVATAVGGVEPALDGGNAGLLVPPNNRDALVEAVLRIVDDASLRDRLVARGLELARALTLESESERVAQFLDSR